MSSYATLYTYPSELDTSGSTFIQPDNLIVIEELLARLQLVVSIVLDRVVVSLRMTYNNTITFLNLGVRIKP